jgi:hypothetical protein
MSTYPFQNIDLEPTNDVSSEPVLIFGKQNTSIIESMIFANNLDAPVLFSFYLLRENQDQTTTKYIFANNVTLDNKQSIDWLYNKKSIFVRGEDTLWAYSDYSNNLFSVFISYRELTEAASA